MNLKPPTVPPLRHGQRLKQPEFHRRYQACDEDQKFELVGGTVYMASPLSWSHGTYHQKLGFVLGHYAAGTPGVEVGDNATVILGEESEPQPDLTVRIRTECGGRSRVNDQNYVEGPPEFVAEIAYSSQSLDLNQKRRDYEACGVQEYLVLDVEGQELHWFHFPSGRDLKPGRGPVLRSVVLPGLWIDKTALLAQDGPRLIEVVQQGLSSRAHGAFVRRLEAARRRSRTAGGSEDQS
jgi:Uma2 family endonuclease